METKTKRSRVRTFCRRAGVATVVTAGTLLVPTVAGAAPPDPTLPPANFDSMGNEITEGAGSMIGFVNTKYVPALAAVMIVGLGVTVGKKLFRRLTGAV